MPIILKKHDAYVKNGCLLKHGFRRVVNGKLVNYDACSVVYTNPNLASVAEIVADNCECEYNDFVWTVKSVNSTRGLRVDIDNPIVGETYTLSYKFQKVGGTLQRIGGHRGGYYPVDDKWMLDGVVASSTYPRGVDIADDDTVHSVVVTAVYKGDDKSGANYICIHPNRMGSVGVDAKIWDIKLEQGDTATPWIPAEEDV